MKRFNVGDIVIAVFTQPLPGKEIAPKLTLKAEYEIKTICEDKKGNQHIDVGLKSDVNSVTSFETNKELPGGIRLCHPNRFILKSSTILP
jgi:hypothetical protein